MSNSVLNASNTVTFFTISIESLPLEAHRCTTMTHNTEDVSLLYDLSQVMRIPSIASISRSDNTVFQIESPPEPILVTAKCTQYHITTFIDLRCTLYIICKLSRLDKSRAATLSTATLSYRTLSSTSRNDYLVDTLKWRIPIALDIRHVATANLYRPAKDYILWF